MRKCRLDSSSLEQDLGVGSCEHSNKLLGSIKCGEFLDQLSD
jgi:hypothetical protein